MNRAAEPSPSRSRESLPRAVIKPTRRSWLLWLIPLGAAALCVWFAYRDFLAQGPTIQILFDSAEGLEEKNTQLQYRGATVGEVKKIRLAKDLRHVEVEAQLIGSAKDLARAGSIFWIVRPEVSIGSISGLRTIVSGEYLAIRPGNGPPTNAFAGADKEPRLDQPGALQLILLTDNLGSLQEQSPIYYRGVQAGEILYFQLAEDARNVVIHARVWREYAPLVRPESKFWNAGGFDVRAGLFRGVEISAQSPKAILSGGIEFATPPNSRAQASNDTLFALNPKPEDAWKLWAPPIQLNLPPEASQTNASPNGFLK